MLSAHSDMGSSKTFWTFFLAVSSMRETSDNGILCNWLWHISILTVLTLLSESCYWAGNTFSLIILQTSWHKRNTYFLVVIKNNIIMGQHIPFLCIKLNVWINIKFLNFWLAQNKDKRRSVLGKVTSHSIKCLVEGGGGGTDYFQGLCSMEVYKDC